MTDERRVWFTLMSLINERMRVSVGCIGKDKRPGLYIYETPNSLRKVGTLKNDEEAEMFIRYLGEMMGALDDTGVEI